MFNIVRRTTIVSSNFRPTFSPSKPSRKQAKTALKMRSVFTGKETDCETGFSYFGARYYDPTLLTSWTAVDPMSDKYPNISPYAYCAWNPVKLVDPDGKDIWDLNKDGELIWKESSETDQIHANGHFLTSQRMSWNVGKATQKAKTIISLTLKIIWKAQLQFLNLCRIMPMWNLVY